MVAPAGLREELELERHAAAEHELERAEHWTAGRYAHSVAAAQARNRALDRVAALERRLARADAGEPAPTLYRLPPVFYDDHVARALPAGELVRRTSRHVFVELDAAAFDELVSDARYYADEMGDAGFDGHGLVTSARATLRALEAAGRPLEATA